MEWIESCTRVPVQLFHIWLEKRPQSLLVSFVAVPNKFCAELNFTTSLLNTLQNLIVLGKLGLNIEESTRKNTLDILQRLAAVIFQFTTCHVKMQNLSLSRCICFIQIQLSCGKMVLNKRLAEYATSGLYDVSWTPNSSLKPKHKATTIIAFR